jgi:hypothetical protein
LVNGNYHSIKRKKSNSSFDLSYPINRFPRNRIELNLPQQTQSKTPENNAINIVFLRKDEN